MSFMGVMPFGSLLAGSVSERIGVQNTLLGGAVFCILGAFIFALQLPRLHEQLRPVYARIGIAPEAKREGALHDVVGSGR